MRLVQLDFLRIPYPTPPEAAPEGVVLQHFRQLNGGARIVYKNFAQKWVVFAFNETTGIEKTGDASNITAEVRIDGGATISVTDTNPTELTGGYYVFDIDEDESNGEMITIIPTSTTADIQVIGAPATVHTFANVICGVCTGTPGADNQLVTDLETTHGLTTSSALNGRVVIFDQTTTTPALKQQAGNITAYDGTSGLITVETNFTTNSVSGDSFKIY